MSALSFSLRTFARVLNKPNVAGQLKNVTRNSHVTSYRVGPPPHSRATRITAEVVGAAMWYWVLYHIYDEYDHIIGEFTYVKPSTWSNAELGVPPDDVC